MDYYEITSLDPRYSFLKKHFSPAASLLDKDPECDAASAVRVDVDDDDDWALDGAVGLDGVKQVGAKHHLPDFEDRCRAMKRKVPGTNIETFQFATEMVKQEALSDVCLSAEPVSIKVDLATAQVAVKEAKDK